MPRDLTGGGSAAQLGSALSEELQKLKRGVISDEEYLEALVASAIAELGPLLSDEQGEAIRELMREHFSKDPVICEYVRRAAR